MSKREKEPIYPNRPAVLTAARTGDLAVRKQLTPEDQLYFDLAARFDVVGEIPLSSAPAAWIKRAGSLADPQPTRSRLARLIGKLTFDSWSHQPALGTRSVASAERRVRFEADGLKLDLRAELHSGAWHFVGRIVVQPDEESYRLVANDEEIFADDTGFFHWSSPNPPSTVALVSGNTTVELAALSWDRNEQE